MSDEMNPFNCTKPGNLFTGYSEELRDVANGFLNSKSFAILGGHRCGKTSLLLKLEEMVRQKAALSPGPFVRVIDLGGEVPHSPFEFFASLYRAVVKDCEGAESWSQATSTQPYQEFLGLLRKALPAIEKKHGSNWLAVLLIDKLDLAKGEASLDLGNQSRHAEVFTGLRNLLQLDELRGRFRLVGTGGSDMYKLVREGSPLANILTPVWLRSLDEKEADQLCNSLSMNLTQALRHQLFNLSGRHPFIIQGLLELIWEDREKITESIINDAAKRFRRDWGNVFQHWVQRLGAERCNVYQAVAEGEGRASVPEIKRRLHIAEIDEALRVLSFHGVIGDSEDEDHPQIAGTIFSNWFMRNAPVERKINSGTASKRFAVAFSFAGETRDRVDPIATRVALELPRGKVLYDKFYEAEFAVLNLDTHLQRLYNDESELVVVVICGEYNSKLWTGLEWRAIRNSINQGRGDSIMLLRTDDGQVDGLFAGDGYVDLRKNSDKEAAQLILERLELVRINR